MAKELHAGKGPGRYKILIGKNSLSKKNLIPLIKGHAKTLIITDSGVPKTIIQAAKVICSAHTKVFQLIIPQGEKSKSLKTFQDVITFLIAKNFDRSDVIIALGGGVVGDLAGFVASAYLRGIPFIQIPTTLLSQVDSSVGGKTAINVPHGKNLVGAFYNPKGVIIDTSSLSSLPKKEFNAGLAEVIKYGLIKNRMLLEILITKIQLIQSLNPRLIETIIYESIATKSQIVTKDEKENGIRAILNFGHTIGHAIEGYHNYKNILHGEAVAKGMLAASKISCLEGMITQEEYLKIKKLLSDYEFDLEMDQYKYSQLKPFILRDKKVQQGSLNLVLLDGVSNAISTNTFDPINLKKSIT